ncbi:MAG: porphobilinogen deaminase [Deltaproteobacteria bacterium]|nr:porphobilinogen deaminase [Deltaproteobacteria bacterium]
MIRMSCPSWGPSADFSISKEGGIKTKIRIGTRGSALALTQSTWVADSIRGRHPDCEVELITIKTKGDIMQDVSLVQIGGKGLFIKEIEEALLRGDVDVAVHSMKDVPAELPDGLEIAVTPLREDPRDVLVSSGNRKLEEMPRGARIGTCSLRRGCQLRNRMPDLEIVTLRGNLDTRIRKVETEGLDGVIVAAAGIRRMGWVAKVSQFIPVELMLPAVGQGVLGIETRKDDARVRGAIDFLNDPVTGCEVGAERSFLKRLEGGCQLPIAALAKKTGESITLEGLVGSEDGRVMIRDAVKGAADAYEAVGRELAEKILARGGRAILDEVYREKG